MALDWIGHKPAGRRDAAFLQNAGIGGLALPRALPWAEVAQPRWSRAAAIG